MRDLTNVEKNIIRAIYHEAGAKSMIELMIGLAAENAALPTSPEKGKAEPIARGGLTARELEMIIRIAESEYGDGPEDATWTDVICENRSDSAVVGSLVKKGFATTTAPMEKVGDCTDGTITLTVRGLTAYRESRPDSQYARDHAQVEAEQVVAERAYPNL